MFLFFIHYILIFFHKVRDNESKSSTGCDGREGSLVLAKKPFLRSKNFISVTKKTFLCSKNFISVAKKISWAQWPLRDIEEGALKSVRDNKSSRFEIPSSCLPCLIFSRYQKVWDTEYSRYRESAVFWK